MNLDAILALGPPDPEHPLNAKEETTTLEEYAAAYRRWVQERILTHRA